MFNTMNSGTGTLTPFPEREREKFINIHYLLLQYIRYRTPFSVRILRVGWSSGLFTLLLNICP